MLPWRHRSVFRGTEPREFMGGSLLGVSSRDGFLRDAESDIVSTADHTFG